MQQQLKKLGPKSTTFGVTTLTLLSSLVAWFVVPGGRLATLLSLGAGGASGRELGKRLRAQRKAVLPATIAELIKTSGVRDLNPDEIRDLGDRYGLTPEELEEQIKMVYGLYLAAMAEYDDSVQSKEISTLAALRRGLGLRWNATVAVHETVAGKLEADDEEERKKMMWLTAGLFVTSKGRADTDGVKAALGLDDSSAQRIVNELSTPLYKRAVGMAVGKYNRTETPEVLQAIRQALCLSEGAAQTVHTALYDAQLRLNLPDEPGAKLTEESQMLLGELEGVLQVRGAVRRLQARTVPLYRSTAKDALTTALQSPIDATSAASVWGGLALRQQELSLPTATARAALVEEARAIGSQQLADAVELMSAGSDEAAIALLEQLLSYGSFVGRMLTLSGWDDDAGFGDDAAAALSERYLGALTIAPDKEAEANKLADVLLARGTTGSRAELLRSMLALASPELEGAKAKYSARLDAVLASCAKPEGVTDSAELSAELADLGAFLGLPEAVQQKLGLETYYGWLLDLSENLSRPVLERASDVRQVLRLNDASVGELYTNTAVDVLVLEKAISQLADEGGDGRVSSEDESWVLFLERLMLARPGVAIELLGGQ